MIRFQPDTAWQAATRFFDMAAPDANVYVEIPAPDIRFAAIVLLAAALLLAWRRLAPGRKPVFALLAMILAASGVWLATTGNGRYFMAVLVCAGPVAVALICLLPVTRALQAMLAGLLVAGQAFVLWQQPPWDTWTVMHWTKAPYFAVKVAPQETQGPPTTYATLSLLTYSLMAPQFPPESRWISLHAGNATPRDEQWTQDFLRAAVAAGPVRVVGPSVPGASLPNALPNPDMVVALDKLAARRNLRIDGECSHIVSEGLLAMAQNEGKSPEPGAIPLGFWSCPVALRGITPGAEPPPVPESVLAAYRKAGEGCPRFFPPGEIQPLRLKDGWVVRYGSQTRMYVMDSQDVWYQFWRSLNPVRVGTVPDLLADRARIDCAAVRNDGAWRTGAP